VEPGESHTEVALEDTEILIVKAMPNIQFPIGAGGPSNLSAATSKK